MRAHRPSLLIFAVIAMGVLALASAAYATTNIVSSPSTSHWAWNDSIGWIDFLNPADGNVIVSGTGLSGFATSSVGAISLDCATSPAGNICGTSSYQVLNDGTGNLSGWAWNDAIGWISFCGGSGTANCPGSVSYRTLIDGTTGSFSQWAWNDLVGWISFNCTDPGVCGTSTYKVQTTWAATSTTGYIDSSTFDTGVSSGAQINSIIWHGSIASPRNGSFVAFQIASAATTTAAWSYIGPDGTTSSYYGATVAPGASIPVDYTLHNNQRFFRYRMTLSTTVTQSSSPRVDDVSVNWSR